MQACPASAKRMPSLTHPRVMRRLLIVLLVLVCVLALAIPWLVGLGVQDRFEELTAQDSRIAGRQVGEHRLDRGWFASEIAVELVETGSDPWLYRSAIDHGPFTASPPRWASAHGVLETGAGELAMDWWITPDGSLNGQVRPAPDLGAGSLSFQTSGADTVARLENLHLPPLLSGAGGQVAIAQPRPDAAQWSAQLTAQRLALQAPIELQELALDSEGRRLGEALAMVLRLRAQRLRYAGLELDQPQIHLDLDQLHLPTLRQLGQSLDNFDLGADPARLRNLLVTSLAPLLYQQPEIRALRLAANSERGAFEAELSARFIRRPPAGFVGDFSQLASVLELEGQGRLDEGILTWWAARQVRREYPGLSDPGYYDALAQRYIESLLENRILVPDADGYRFELDYQPGRLLLNDQPRSLPDGW